MFEDLILSYYFCIFNAHEVIPIWQLDLNAAETDLMPSDR